MSVLLTLVVFSTAGMAAATGGINPPKENITTYLQGYDLQGQNNSLELACEIGQNVTELGWNCDVYVIHFSGHKDEYVNTFYHYENNAKGYKACYYWLGPQKKEVEDISKKEFKYKNLGVSGVFNCQIPGMLRYERVNSFFGKDLTVEENTTIEENTTAEENVSNEINNTCDPVKNTTEEVVNNTVENETENLTSTIELNVKNYTSGNSANITANLQSQPSKGLLDEITESIRHLLYAINLN